MMRTLVKRSAELLMCRTGFSRAARTRLSGDVLVLAYHNVIPEGQVAVGDSSLHLPQRAFAAQLDLLQRTHDVVSIDEALTGRKGSGRPRVVITFDDAYCGALRAGVQELVRRGMPATIFVAPAFLDGGSFWWDALAGTEGLPESVRTHGLERLQGKDAVIRAWAATRGMVIRSLPAHQTVASRTELAEALHHPGIDLAPHTWSHPNLASLDAGELEMELRCPLEWLRVHYHERVVPWISFPYGLHSPRVQQVAADAGYAGAFRVEGGWLPRQSDPARRFCLPRLNVPAGLTIEGFELRASGLLSR